MEENEISDSAFTTIDSFLVLVILIISSCARLWTISFPEQVSFDEVHFGNFTSWYVKHKFHFDIHPPLGKMMMAFIAGLGQFEGEIRAFHNIGSSYAVNESQYISLRLIPGIFASFCAPFIYCSSRCLYVDPLSAFMASMFIALDSSFITEAKFVLSDGMLHFWCAFHIFTLSLFLRHPSELLAIFAGFTLGAAGVCKYTGLGLFAVDGITQLIWILWKRPSIWKIMIRGCSFLTPAAVVMFGAWVWHFAANPYRGYHAHYIAAQDSHTVLDRHKINVSYWGNRVAGSSLIGRIVRWNREMNRINMRSKIPHPWESRPEYWPFLMDKYVLFWARDRAKVQCMGLPASYWGTTLALFLTVPAALCGRTGWQNWLFVWGWAVCYLPFLRIPRTMFHYHYLVPLMFASLNTGALVSLVFKNQSARASVATIVTVLTILCYLYFAPLIYGIDCPNCDRTRAWVKGWSLGPPKPVHCFGKELINTTQLILAKIPL
jgi:dolichyl-phosphate-mannose-protein mannosyltransferase